MNIWRPFEANLAKGAGMCYKPLPDPKRGNSMEISELKMAISELTARIEQIRDWL